MSFSIRLLPSALSSDHCDVGSTGRGFVLLAPVIAGHMFTPVTTPAAVSSSGR